MVVVFRHSASYPFLISGCATTGSKVMFPHCLYLLFSCTVLPGGTTLLLPIIYSEQRRIIWDIIRGSSCPLSRAIHRNGGQILRGVIGISGKQSAPDSKVEVCRAPTRAPTPSMADTQHQPYNGLSMQVIHFHVPDDPEVREAVTWALKVCHEAIVNTGY